MNYWLSIKTMISEGIVEIKCQVVSKIFPIPYVLNDLLQITKLTASGSNTETNTSMNQFTMMSLVVMLAMIP